MSLQDRELQIELAELEIEYQNNMAIYTILVSVFVSLIITSLSVYIPLGLQTGIFTYILIAIIYPSLLMLPTLLVLTKILYTRKQFKKQIQTLKKRYVW